MNLADAVREEWEQRSWLGEQYRHLQRRDKDGLNEDVSGGRYKKWADSGMYFEDKPDKDVVRQGQ